MLKILDEKVLKTDTEIRNLYKDCKYVLYRRQLR